MVLPVKLDGVTGKKLYASATRDEGRGEVIVKLVNGDNVSVGVKLNLSGNARLTTLTGANLTDENSFTAPKKVSPKESTMKLSAGKTITLPPNSLTVLRVAVGK